MRLSSVRLFLPLLLACGVLQAQVPRVGTVDYYGLRRVSRERLDKVLNVHPGDPLPPSKGDVEDRLEEIPGIVAARLEAVCCEAGKAVLFVGVEEKAAPHFAFRSPPRSDRLLPETIVDTYRKYVGAVENAARRGKAAEDLTQGHPLMADPDARDYQELFVTYAKENVDLIRRVLRESADEEHREIATALINYAPKKASIVDDLQYAMQDPDENVRANAMRSLSAIAVLARRKPDLEIKISPTWMIEMLNSIYLSDRTRAAAALVTLTEKDSGNALAQIRERALPSLVEMARWNSLKHAVPAYVLLGRIAGLTAEQIEDTWGKGERESVIETVLPGRNR